MAGFEPAAFTPLRDAMTKTNHSQVYTKKAEHSCSAFVGVAGFEPTTLAPRRHAIRFGLGLIEVLKESFCPSCFNLLFQSHCLLAVFSHCAPDQFPGDSIFNGRCFSGIMFLNSSLEVIRMSGIVPFYWWRKKYVNEHKMKKSSHLAGLLSGWQDSNLRPWRQGATR